VFRDSTQFISIHFNSIQFISIQFISIQFISIHFNSIQFNSIQFYFDRILIVLLLSNSLIIAIFMTIARILSVYLLFLNKG